MLATAKELTHKDKTITVEFLWEAIDLLVDLWGEERFFERANNAIERKLPRDLAVMLSAASGGAMTMKDVMVWSPPVLETTRTIESAWVLAWAGSSKLNELMEIKARAKTFSEENPQTAQKKPGMLSRMLSRLLSNTASAGPPSVH